jgi:hypothetical protein
MTLTITVSDELAKRLRAQAAARKLSVQQWAVAVLVNASQSPENAATWMDLNNRRVALICKRYETSLSEAEIQELAKLQEATAAILEPFDRQRLEQVRCLVQDADGTTRP